MYDANFNGPRLHVYDQGRDIRRITQPTTSQLLQWLARLHENRVTELVLMHSFGCLVLGKWTGQICICFCSYDLEVCESEITSLESAAEQLLLFRDLSELPPRARGVSKPAASPTGNTAQPIDSHSPFGLCM